MTQLAMKLRDRSEADVSKHLAKLSPWSHEALEREIGWLADTMDGFTSETVEGRLEAGTRAALELVPNAIGHEISKASRRGRIEWTGKMVASSKDSRKGGLLRVWRGVR